QRVERDRHQQIKRQLTDARDEVAVKRRHQPEEEQLAVGRRVRLRLVAERRRDEEQAVLLQPPRGKQQVVADAVVERQRRIATPGRDREGENRTEEDGEREGRVSQVD